MFNNKNKIITTPPYKNLEYNVIARNEMTKQSIQNHCFYNGLPRYARNDGFTLAEVLITLVIIGVIAAITVPTLIVKYQKEQTVTRLKKAYSSLAQTTQRAIADNGPITAWEIGSNSSGEAAHNFLTKYLFPYLNIMKDCITETSNNCEFKYSYLNEKNIINRFGSSYSRFYLSDGTLIAATIENSSTNKRIYIYIDINGQKKPNQFGKDIFRYNYTIKETNYPITEGKITPDGIMHTRSSLISDSNNRCNKNQNGMTCSSLIMKDGWQIKDDYPW